MFNFWLRKNRPGDPERFFKIDHLQQDLKRRSVRGGAVTLISQGGKFVLQMVSTAVLARLLTPADYGLIGMTTVVTGFIQLFQEVGLSAATIQNPSINHKQVSTLFWINSSLGLGLTLLTLLLSPTIAWFYEEPRVYAIMSALSVNFLISGLGVQHQALLQRQMKFKWLAIIVLLSMLLGTIAAIIAARLGAGYWSLVVLMLVQTLTKTIAAWVLCRWKPGWPDRKSGIGDMLRFGGNITGFNTVNYFSRNLDNVLIGRLWGAQQLGIYSKAYQLVLLPVTQINSPITSVALPVLSRLQDNPQEYKKYYYKAVLIISSIGVPLVVFLFIDAPSVILVLLGRQWLEVVPIFRLLMPAALNATIGVALGWAFNSLSQTNRQLKWGIWSSLANVILFVVGVRWGAVGVAAAYGLSRPIFLVIGFFYCYQKNFLSLLELSKTLAHPIIASIFASTVLLASSQLISNNLGLLSSLIIKSLIFFLSYSVVWTIMPNGKETISTVVKALNSKKSV